jgi:hypothetical protein
MVADITSNLLPPFFLLLPEDRGNRFPQNTGKHLLEHKSEVYNI